MHFILSARWSFMFIIHDIKLSWIGRFLNICWLKEKGNNNGTIGHSNRIKMKNKYPKKLFSPCRWVLFLLNRNLFKLFTLFYRTFELSSYQTEAHTQHTHTPTDAHIYTFRDRDPSPRAWNTLILFSKCPLILFNLITNFMQFFVFRNFWSHRPSYQNPSEYVIDKTNETPTTDFCYIRMIQKKAAAENFPFQLHDCNNMFKL